MILTNPPFGGEEGIDSQAHFDFKTTSASVLFLQHIVERLKPGGTCGMVIDEGVLYRSTEKAYLETKKWMLDACDLWCIVSLPGGLFVNAGAGVKTDLMLFTKGRSTERIWYYDLSDVKVNKGNPFTLDNLKDFFEKLDSRATSERSWTVDIEEVKRANYSVEAINPNAPDTGDRRTPEELLTIIEEAQNEIAQGVASLRAAARNAGQRADARASARGRPGGAATGRRGSRLAHMRTASRPR